MSTLWMIQLLFAALALVMAGLGLSLRVEDFTRLAAQKRGVAVALLLQMVVLPAVALGLAVAFELSGPLAVGLILLAATPGSISANLYSHLFGGNLAFTIALTGVNTLLCALTLPLLVGWAIGHFVGTGHMLPVLYDKAVQTIGVVLVPVALGMVVAAKAPRFGRRVAKPVKILSAAVVVIFSVAAIVKEREALVEGFGQVGASVLLFNGISLALGYAVSLLARIGRSETIAVAFQVSVHNAILAIYVAMAVLDAPLIALPAAVYSISLNFFALGLGAVLAAWHRRTALSVVGLDRPGAS